MTDREIIEAVQQCEPAALHPPRSHPSTNMGGYMNGRSAYEVEEEMLALYFNISSTWRRVFQRSYWRLRLLEFTYWSTSAKSVIADRRKYLESL